MSMGDKNEIQLPSGMEEDDSLRFFLMGKTGTGKSATGNSILAEERFKSEGSLKSVTTDVELHQALVLGNVVKVMDSPGLFDTQQSEAEVAAVLVKAVATLHPGPHVLLFVVKLGRYTQEDHAVYTRLKALLDDHIKRYTIVVFTHADTFNPGPQQSVHQAIRDGPDNLKQLMADCGNRYVLFNNNANNAKKKQSQLNDLMSLVMKIKNDNRHQPYQCPRYAYVTEKIEEETKKRLDEVEKKEMEMKRHYQQLQRQLEQRERELERRWRAMQRKEQELETRQEKQVKRLQDRIRELEQQLNTGSNNQHPGQRADPQVVQAFQQEIAKLQDQVKTISAERQTAISNSQNLEINIMSEKNKMEKELQELREKHSEEDEEKKKLEERLAELNNASSKEDEDKKKLQEELEAQKKKQENFDLIQASMQQQQAAINQLLEEIKKNEEAKKNEQRQKDEELAQARRRLEQLEEDRRQRQIYEEHQNEKSRLCVIL